VSAALVDLQVAVKRERACLVSAEFKRDGRIGTYALGDAIRVDPHTVCDIARAQLNLHDIALYNLDPAWNELVPFGSYRNTMR
jgi:hypothetical protein